jgi:hypothetical protein
VPRDEAERLGEVLQPVTKDAGAQLTISVTSNTGPVTIAPIIITSERANAVRNGIRRYLDPHSHLKAGSNVKSSTWTKYGEILARKREIEASLSASTRSPSNCSLPLPRAKGEILDNPENPFRMAYEVDGHVTTIEGKPTLYRINAAHDARER